MNTLKNNPLTPESSRIYDVLIAPLITEKATAALEKGQYMFKVAKECTKADIKIAVEKLYKVKVEGVQTLTIKGKTKRFRGRIGKKNDVKKAFVRLAEGQKIDLSAGL